DPKGRTVTDPVVLQRIKELVIPPAWDDVWICEPANGHIQAVGTDDAGRRQYLYHTAWREQRDQLKHDRILVVARRLAKARDRADLDLERSGMPRERALATAFRLLDLGFFRVGGESYVEANGSYGLATLLRRHVRIERGDLVFSYVAKSGKHRRLILSDPPSVRAVRTMLRRRGGGQELLAYQDGRRWRDVTSSDINGYVKELIGGDCSAKDFRTWHATVLAAVILAESADSGATQTARKRAVSRAMAEVSEYLGNTPTIARKSYVDPRVIDLFEDGVTIQSALARVVKRGDVAAADVPAAEHDELPETHGDIERAVLRMLKQAPKASGRSAR
ncbi:MAG: topoisomerase, partial [Pseudonocardiales bacterium]|nr:topoisomerase [Pseudonocardiales bacterium]